MPSFLPLKHNMSLFLISMAAGRKQGDLKAVKLGQQHQKDTSPLVFKIMRGNIWINHSFCQWKLVEKLAAEWLKTVTIFVVQDLFIDNQVHKRQTYVCLTLF